MAWSKNRTASATVARAESPPSMLSTAARPSIESILFAATTQDYALRGADSMAKVDACASWSSEAGPGNMQS